MVLFTYVVLLIFLFLCALYDQGYSKQRLTQSLLAYLFIKILPNQAVETKLDLDDHKYIYIFLKRKTPFDSKCKVTMMAKTGKNW